jgi:hypothetical protein
MNVAGLERAERPLAARTAVPYWSAHTALGRCHVGRHVVMGSEISTIMNPRNEGVRNGMRFLGLAPSAHFCANDAHSVSNIHIKYLFVQFSRAKPSVCITN